MKIWKLLLFKRWVMPLRKLRQRGQSVVEFVLLLSVISGISLFFVSFMNRSISKYWVNAVKIIVEDSSQDVSIK